MSAEGATPPTVLAYAPRDRTRAWAKRLAGKRSGKVTLTRSVDEFSAYFHQELIDVALVDVGAGNGAEGAAALAREYPTVAFLALASLRPAEGPALARCAELDFADMLVESVDEDVARELVTRYAYSTRFGNALATSPPELGLESALHRATWQYLVSHGGRPALTSAIAASLGVTREHLSRSFGAGRVPPLKRVIDLVRLLSAAELAKNPGYDAGDVARVLRYSSSTHLSSTALRLIGRRASSLSALRGVDVIERFVREHATNGRSPRRPALAPSSRLGRGDS
jgi:AraC-like DNA-binding protein